MNWCKPATAWVVAMVLACPAMARPETDPICAHLRAFAGSVTPGETRTVEFRTAWGGGFRGTTGFVLYEKRCEHFHYAPGNALCDSLMKDGYVEFAGNNALRAITCLSPALQIRRNYHLARIDIELPYGTDQRGSTVAIRFDDDKDVGGELLSITAEGY